MSRLYNILNTIVSKCSTKDITLTASNWTATNASLTSGLVRTYGNVCIVALSLRLTSALNVGTEYDLGTFKGIDGVTFNSSTLGTSPQGNLSVVGSGTLRVMPTRAMANGANFYPRIVFITDGGGIT